MNISHRTNIVRVCAVVLLASIGGGIASPVLALGDIADRLSVNGIAPEALDAAMEAAGTSHTPTELAQAVSEALGEESLPATAFLRALYGNLYELMLVQQGPKAVASASASLSGKHVCAACNVRSTDLHAPGKWVDDLGVSQSETFQLPRFRFPAVQPLGP